MRGSEECGWGKGMRERVDEGGGGSSEWMGGKMIGCQRTLLSLAAFAR